MFHLPTPYPDELLGSILIRAQRLTGLGGKLLLPKLTGARITTHSPVLTKYPLLASSHGMRMEDFVKQHTLLPYATAYMEPLQRDRIWARLLSEPHATNIASLAQHATKGITHYQLCRACMGEDLRHFGESYWRRSHHLPGVGWCLKHDRLVVATCLSLCSRETKLLLPHEAPQVGQPLAWAQLLRNTPGKKLSQASVATLHEPADRGYASHRKKATQAGYALSRHNIWGQVLAQDLRRYFTSPLLARLGSDFELEPRSWPTTILRPSGGSAAPVRHALMDAFLSSAPRPSRPPDAYMRRKKAKPKDWRAIELRALKTMRAMVEEHVRSQTRVTVTELVERADLSGPWKHRRSQFTEINGWLQEFKASPQSERQTGRRPRAYTSRRKRSQKAPP